ncbi:FAD-binding monooxygenase [Corynebacterium sp. CCM 9185]|uniref:FAD-binding monooxygenase n=1 Tax=Corynebacterium marambiense TaxID=2765364 RepID=A0ABS0VXM4_9CORY|nr:FAD-binding monooxygenase [Corynebacterium marambiense]MBI9001528.1 FAD-binding monooxygenase [Corynebacterium marambiense]MCK7663949.1 FAD-binding monooxygenase [Corynebacterium marambiense]
MQFHHHGYVSGDPRRHPAAGTGLDRPTDLPDTMDVLVVGAGPAGMITAAQLSMFPHLSTRIIDRRPHRLEVGQADGIQARSVETFQAFGFASEVTDEAYRITEMAFWKPDPANPDHIYRANRAIDDETGVSEFPHLIVNQARVLDYFAEFMDNSPSRMRPDYGWEFVDLTVADDPDATDYPVTVRLRRTGDDNPDAGTERTIRARYVVGCDGARSGVRRAIGRKLEGDQANHAWGVMDVLAATDFPDIRLKCAIQSRSGGSILLIPREGGHLFRMYVDLGTVTEERKATIRSTTIEEIIAKANEILTPYRVDVRHVAWHSVYEVGHRLTDKFDDVDDGERTPRVFITGDACHTHSAKAGQGMNVSMQDGFNIGWKLGAVLSGTSPAELLHTYSAERQVVAKDLIDFDRTWSTLMATPPEEFDDPSFLEDFYVKTAEFPAGFMTEYAPSLITGGTEHQELATGYPVGKRFKSAIVSRVCDTNPIHLGHQATADGRWRVYVFADGAPAGTQDSAVATWAEWVATDPDSPLVWGPKPGPDDDSLLDLRVIYQQLHADILINEVPRVFFPEVGPFRLTNMEKVFGVTTSDDIFTDRGISRDGAVVVVRPDQYVAAVLPLNEPEALGAFFRPVFGG